MFLRRLHISQSGHALASLASSAGKLHWPPVRHKDRRAIAWDSAGRSLTGSTTRKSKRITNCCWHLGGVADSDIARIGAGRGRGLERPHVCLYRAKDEGAGRSHHQTRFGADVAAPAIGNRCLKAALVPYRMARIQENHRAKGCLCKRHENCGDHRHFATMSYRWPGRNRPRRWNAGTVRTAGAWTRTSEAMRQTYSRKAPVVSAFAQEESRRKDRANAAHGVYRCRRRNQTQPAAAGNCQRIKEAI